MGEVSSSSIVPDRFSSAYVRIVIIGSTKSSTTVALSSSGRTNCWLRLSGAACMPMPPIMPCRTNQSRIAT